MKKANINIIHMVLFQLAIIVSFKVYAGDFFVSPGGGAQGDGSAGAPWDLQTALSHPQALQPGDTIWLMGGQYLAPQLGFTSILQGTELNPIVVRAMIGERATIDGRLIINSRDTWYWNLEITISDPPPPIQLSRDEQNQGYEDGTYRFSGLDIRTDARNRLINNVVHDNHIGISLSTGATDVEFHGNIVYHNGRLASDLPSGHGMYIQNQGSKGFKNFSSNIIANNYLNGLNMYSAGSSYVQNMQVRDNIVFSNGIEGLPLHGVNLYLEAPNPLRNLIFRNNVFYTPKPEPPYTDPVLTNLQMRGTGLEQNLVFDNNVFANGGMLVMFLEQFVFTGNRMGPGLELQLRFPQDMLTNYEYEMDNNDYSQLNFNPWYFVDGSYTGLNTGSSLAGFAQWQGILSGLGVSGADSNSSFSEDPPGDVIVWLEPNLYEQGRANIAIIIFGDQQGVEIDPGSVLLPGTEYLLRKVDDYYGEPAMQGVYDGSPINIPRSLMGQVNNTDDDFAAFVLLDKRLELPVTVFKNGFESQ